MVGRDEDNKGGGEGGRGEEKGWREEEKENVYQVNDKWASSQQANNVDLEVSKVSCTSQSTRSATEHLKQATFLVFL